jgi:hypothetical protein
LVEIFLELKLKHPKLYCTYIASVFVQKIFASTLLCDLKNPREKPKNLNPVYLQDTLFLRPGSPSGGANHRGVKTPDGSEPDLGSSGSGWAVPGMPGPPLLSDRPHTISSAYEKGHQRPSLQPYTFNPPERTIMEVNWKPFC